MSIFKSFQEKSSKGESYYLIGPFPPPIGGISVYIYRFGRLLESQGYSVKYVDFGDQTKIRKIFVLILFILKPSFAHFHLNEINYAVMAALTLRMFPGRILLRSFRARHRRYFIIWTIDIEFVFRKVDDCIFVGDHLVEYYIRKGLKLPKNFQVKNAFLPPPQEDENNIWKSYSSETLKFINNHKPLIVANAFQIVIYQEIDLYGIDMCIDLIVQLKGRYPDIGLVFALAEIGNYEYYTLMNQRIDANEIRKNFYFLVGQKELWPIFKEADLSVRPTYNDGYGISVAESLYFGCPAVASNACRRPVGTQLFKNRDLDDLILKVNEILKN